jgi:peptide/nickel transport system permease protein
MNTVAEIGPNPATEDPRERGRPSIVILVSLFVLGVILVCALLGAAIAPHDPSQQSLVSGGLGPSGSHLLGTDDFGRDVLSRLIAGARTAVVGPLVVAAGSFVVGNCLGLLAGWNGGWIDGTIMRLIDFIWALPALLIAIVVIGVIGGGYWLAVALLIVFTVPTDARVVRAAAAQQRVMPYVDAARVLGLSSTRIMARQIWPNVLPLAMANAFLNFAFSLVALSALSFLGLGVAPGSSDWGRTLAENIESIESTPLTSLAPAIALVVTATAANLCGDWVYERLSDRGRMR